MFIASINESVDFWSTSGLILSHIFKESHQSLALSWALGHVWAEDPEANSGMNYEHA